MKWQGRRQSTNVQDRRGRGIGRGTGLGCGGIIIVLILSFLFGKNPLELLQQVDIASDEPSTEQPYQPTAEEEQMADFVKVVLAYTEDVWNQQFEQMGSTYREPTLVMFTSSVQSACGMASAATGPFYCPSDEKVYIDLSFYNDLKNRFGAPGDFAMAYVIAHEVGHHVQNLLGYTNKMNNARGQLSQAEINKLSVRLELQADFMAGYWAHYADQMADILDPGDIEEALTAANAIGDDRLQRQTQGRIVPDAFTHGTSAQRMKWFRRGYESGDFSQGDTFNSSNL